MVIFAFFCLSIFHANAGITTYLRDSGVTTYLRDTGVIPAVPLNEMTETA